MVQGESQGAGWVPDDDTFGARLALIRQRMGWGNVKEAALACGLPPESWRTWERDGVEPRGIVQKVALISDRTGCDFDWLLWGRRRPTARDVVSSGRPLRRRRPTTMQHSVVRPGAPRPGVGKDRSGQPRRPQRVAIEAA
jgi:hypothetical protein